MDIYFGFAVESTGYVINITIRKRIINLDLGGNQAK